MIRIAWERLLRHHCPLVDRIYKNLLVTIFVSLCFICFILFKQPLNLIPNSCIYCSISKNYLQDIVHDIYTNGSTTKQIVNPNNIEYIHKPLNICDMHKGPEVLLVLVKSYAANIAQRLAIRQTWGNISHTHIKVIYLLGYYSVVQKMIDLESYTYKDVLQGHFFDIYDNNMNKTAMAYQYAVNHCINTQFLFFVDDDFFANIFNIHEYLKKIPTSLKTKLFSGFIIKNEHPFRNRSSKWYLSREEYPYDFFPTYHAGGAILISMTVAKLLKTAFPYVKYIHIDDVYLGIVAMKLDIPLQKENRFELSYTPPLRLKNMFASHGYGDHRQLLTAWDVFLTTMSINRSQI